MATWGYLAWYPSFNSLIFDESHYIELSSTSYFDFASYDFRITLLIYPDSTIADPTNYKKILTKSDGTLANDTGWELYYKPSDGKVGFDINDGDATPATLLSDVGIITNNSWNYIVVEADREGNGTIYVNGVNVITGDISSKVSSINKSEKVTFSGGNCFKGRLCQLSFRRGNGSVCSDTYNLHEYYKIKYGWPRRHIYGGGATWNFAESLTDESDYYTWDYLGGGSASYYGSGFPTNETISFKTLYEYEMGFLPLDNIIRTLGGQAKLYKGPSKRRLFLPMISNDAEQHIALEGAYVSNSLMYVWLDQDNPWEFVGYISESPTIKEIGPGIYQYDVEFEEY